MSLLVSPATLVRSARGSLSLQADDPDDGAMISDALADAEARVEAWLARRLRVAAYAVVDLTWTYHTATGRYTAWAQEWPVVQVEDGEVVGGSRITLEEAPDVVLYYAGYRAEGETLPELQADIPGLEELPPVLPADIRRAIVEIALLYLNSASRGTLGSGRVTQQIGQGSMVTVESVDRDAEVRILRRIKAHQRVL